MTIENFIEAVKDVARKKERDRLEKERRERFGIPDPLTYAISTFGLPSPTPHIPKEPKIKISPYAKFDKFHHKKKKKK